MDKIRNQKAFVIGGGEGNDEEFDGLINAAQNNNGVDMDPQYDYDEYVCFVSTSDRRQTMGICTSKKAAQVYVRRLPDAPGGGNCQALGHIAILAAGTTEQGLRVGLDSSSLRTAAAVYG